MIALAYLTFFVLYIAFCVGVAYLAAAISKLFGYSAKLFGVMGFLAALALVFWDWIPMEVMYANKCATDAGFFQYKTLDQWRLENPGVWKTLDSDVLPEEYLVKVKKGRQKSEDKFYELPNGTKLSVHYDLNGKHTITDVTLKDGREGTLLNQRFYWQIVRIVGSFHIRKVDSRIVDINNNEIIAQFIDYDTDLGHISLGANKLRDYKIWMYKNSCEDSGGDKERFMNLLTRVEKVGDER